MASINARIVRRCAPNSHPNAYCALPISCPRRHGRRILPASRLSSRSAPTSNRHSTRCPASAQLPATSCLGAFCRSPVDVVHATTEMPSARFLAPLPTPMQVALCQHRAHHGRRENQIPIALAAHPAPNFPRLRALALFGRRLVERAERLSLPASKNLTQHQTYAHCRSARVSRPQAANEVS